MRVPRRIRGADHLPTQEHVLGNLPPNVHDTGQGTEELFLDVLFCLALRCEGDRGVRFGKDVANHDVALMLEDATCSRMSRRDLV